MMHNCNNTLAEHIVAALAPGTAKGCSRVATLRILAARKAVLCRPGSRAGSASSADWGKRNQVADFLVRIVPCRARRMVGA